MDLHEYNHIHYNDIVPLFHPPFLLRLYLRNFDLKDVLTFLLFQMGNHLVVLFQVRKIKTPLHDCFVEAYILIHAIGLLP